MNKLEMRLHSKKLRESLEPDEKKLRDDKITYNVLNSELFKSCSSLLLFCSFGSEISTREIFTAAVALKIPTYMPRTDNKKKSMEFLFVSSLDELERRGLGIYEPRENAPKLVPIKNSLCLVPALYADKNGHRIGYGGGYYDRFLSGFNGASAVLIYDELVCPILPSEIYDVTTDYLITESGIYKTIKGET